MRKLANLAICATILSTSNTLAATNKSTAKAKDTAQKKEAKKLSVSSSVTYNSNFYKHSSINHRARADVDAGFSYKLPNKFSVSGILIGSKGLTQTREFELLSSSISLKRPIKKIRDTSLSGSFKFVMPTSEYARKIQRLVFGARLSTPIVTSFKNLGVPGLTVINVPAASVNSHEFKTALNGTSNTRYSLAHTLITSYSVNDWMGVKLLGQYAKSYTYDSNTKDSYLFLQSLVFSIPTVTFSDLSVELGHSKGGTPLGPNGRDTQIQLFDSRTATYFLGLSISL